MMDPEDSAALSTRLLGVAQDILGSLLSPGEPVAVVDHPYNDNFGDSAIWLGQNALLAAGGHHRRHVSDIGRYDARDLARDHPSGPILINGGGNLGDLWPGHQELREQVLRDFPDRRVVQLPQSVFFGDDDARDRAARAMGAHPDFTVLARDRRSLGLGLEMGLRTVLCPDSATHLGPLRRRGHPTRPVMVLARTDHEGSGLREAALAHPRLRDHVVDWYFSPWAHAAFETSKTVPRLQRRVPERWPRVRARMQVPLRGSYDAVSGWGLRAAVRQLSDTHLLVTDRLHAHVIAALMDLPHVVVDNSYGKVRGIYEAYTHTSSRAYLATDVADAVRRTTELLDSRA